MNLYKTVLFLLIAHTDRGMFNPVRTGKYSPQFYFCPLCPCYQWANTTVSGGIQDRVKLFASVLRQKLHEAKIMLCSVNIFSIILLLCIYMYRN